MRFQKVLLDCLVTDDFERPIFLNLSNVSGTEPLFSILKEELLLVLVGKLVVSS